MADDIGVGATKGVSDQGWESGTTDGEGSARADTAAFQSAVVAWRAGGGGTKSARVSRALDLIADMAAWSSATIGSGSLTLCQPRPGKGDKGGTGEPAREPKPAGSTSHSMVS